jgi:hypothetical protein
MLKISQSLNSLYQELTLEALLEIFKPSALNKPSNLNLGLRRGP